MPTSLPRRRRVITLIALGAALALGAVGWLDHFSFRGAVLLVLVPLGALATAQWQADAQSSGNVERVAVRGG